MQGHKYNNMLQICTKYTKKTIKSAEHGLDRLVGDMVCDALRFLRRVPVSSFHCFSVIAFCTASRAHAPVGELLHDLVRVQ